MALRSQRPRSKRFLCQKPLASRRKVAICCPSEEKSGRRHIMAGHHGRDTALTAQRRAPVHTRSSCSQPTAPWPFNGGTDEDKERTCVGRSMQNLHSGAASAVQHSISAET